jgi:hypothetical protein
LSAGSECVVENEIESVAAGSVAVPTGTAELAAAQNGLLVRRETVEPRFT